MTEIEWNFYHVYTNNSNILYKFQLITTVSGAVLANIKIK